MTNSPGLAYQILKEIRDDQKGLLTDVTALKTSFKLHLETHKKEATEKYKGKNWRVSLLQVVTSIFQVVISICSVYIAVKVGLS